MSEQLPRSGELEGAAKPCLMTHPTLPQPFFHLRQSKTTILGNHLSDSASKNSLSSPSLLLAGNILFHATISVQILAAEATLSAALCMLPHSLGLSRDTRLFPSWTLQKPPLVSKAEILVFSPYFSAVIRRPLLNNGRETPSALSSVSPRTLTKLADPPHTSPFTNHTSSWARQVSLRQEPNHSMLLLLLCSLRPMSCYLFRRRFDTRTL